MHIKEFRVVMPMTVAEYQVAQLFCVAEASKENTDSQEGIEILKNEPFQNNPQLGEDFSSGQYTYKIYHFASKVPAFVRYVLPNQSMSVHEEAWNAFPYCRTVLTNPTMGKSFKITIETMHLDDAGDTENAHRLPPELLSQRQVATIDIVNDTVDSKEYKQQEDPSLYHSEKTGRGPLAKNWRETSRPLMTCYKLVKAEFTWFGLQTRVETWIQNAEQRLFLQIHRKLFCTTDQWYGMTMEDIRRMEDEVKKELESRLKNREAIASS